MYTVEFYETQNGECQIWDFLEGLRIKAVSNKDARIQHKQVSLCIELLQQNGTHMNENITKHLEDGIWELRPTNFGKSHKRLQNGNVTIICPERRTVNYENLE